MTGGKPPRPLRDERSAGQGLPVEAVKVDTTAAATLTAIDPDDIGWQGRT
jgi:hypothetical protein